MPVQRAPPAPAAPVPSRPFADGAGDGAAHGAAGDRHHAADAACGIRAEPRHRRPRSPALQPAPGGQGAVEREGEVKEVDKAAERAAEKARLQEQKPPRQKARQKAEKTGWPSESRRRP